MARGNWFSGFAVLRSLIWVATALLLCLIASFGLSNVRLTLAPDSAGISTPVLVAPSPAVEPEREADSEGVVYELDGAYYQIDPSPKADAPPRSMPKASPKAPVSGDPEKTSSEISNDDGNSVYLAEDSIGFLAVVVTPAGGVQVYRQADESFVAD